MLENKSFEGIYYSRFIASWCKIMTGDHDDYVGLVDFIFMPYWLRSLTINDKKIPEDVISEIYELATCGKLELEEHLRAWKKDPDGLSKSIKEIREQYGMN